MSGSCSLDNPTPEVSCPFDVVSQVCTEGFFLCVQFYQELFKEIVIPFYEQQREKVHDKDNHFLDGAGTSRRVGGAC
jgi:hypothetical protein